MPFNLNPRQERLRKDEVSSVPSDKQEIMPYNKLILRKNLTFSN